MKAVMQAGLVGEFETAEGIVRAAHELRKLGYKNISANDLVSMRIHRVTPEYIRELEAAGYVKVPIEKMISMRIHGIDAKFIKKMAD